MNTRTAFGVLLTAIVYILTVANVKTQGLGLFKTEAQAQEHCPKDAVVWLDLGNQIKTLARRERKAGGPSGAVSGAPRGLGKEKPPPKQGAFLG